MATSTSTFWNRIGSMLGFAPRANGGVHDPLDHGATGNVPSGVPELAIDVEGSVGAPSEVLPSGRAGVGSSGVIGVSRTGTESAGALQVPRSGGLLRWASRDPGSTKRDNPERLAALMDAMRAHFESQDRRSEQLTSAVERMAVNLEQLSTAQQAHGACIGSIAAHLETANRHACELRETLARVPSSIQAQAEALRSISRQLELSGEQDAQMALSLQRLGGVVDSLSQAGSAQVDVLQQLRVESDEQRQSLTMLVREQGRRFLIMMIVAGAMVVAALGAMSVAIWIVTTR